MRVANKYDPRLVRTRRLEDVPDWNLEVSNIDFAVFNFGGNGGCSIGEER